ncbi:MAG: signal peptidase I [Bdellovibrionaceae bacterium]|nr:signal peptidase I [Pseudobdellovibrionaceae bacterium]MBX3035011.1 signal peptidase I [Pseudobdellovibrionaceae bacterium]
MMARRNLKGTWIQALIGFFSPVLFILVLRWAVLEPYVIPSGSMIPNLLVHDHLFVKKSAFGLRMPFSDRWLWNWSQPQAGDVLVFRYPPSPAVFYIKRLVGKPGDHVEINDGRIKVNGKAWTLTPIPAPAGQDEDFHYFLENNGEREYIVRFLNEKPDPSSVAEWDVPAGKYFFVGDNRDQSSDGRVWGYVPEKNLIGKAWVIWLSCDEMLESARFVCNPSTMRWSRFFRSGGLD